MEMQLLEKTNQTRIKISIVEWNKNIWLRKKFENVKPEKKNSRFIYFVVDGDLLNRKERSRIARCNHE